MWYTQNGQRCRCPQPNNKKVVLTSANGSTGFTQNQRTAITVTTTLGGNIYFGNAYVYEGKRGTGSRPIQFQGKTEGQPGGVQGPVKNRF